MNSAACSFAEYHTPCAPPPPTSAELRKSLPKEVTKGVGPLLKAYQEEIDRLTQR